MSKKKKSFSYKRNAVLGQENAQLDLEISALEAELEFRTEAIQGQIRAKEALRRENSAEIRRRLRKSN